MNEETLVLARQYTDKQVTISSLPVVQLTTKAPMTAEFRILSPEESAALSLASENWRPICLIFDIEETTARVSAFCPLVCDTTEGSLGGAYVADVSVGIWGVERDADSGMWYMAYMGGIEDANEEGGEMNGDEG